MKRRGDHRPHGADQSSDPHGGAAGHKTSSAHERSLKSALHESESRFESLFTGMLEGYAHCRMIYDDAGQPVDWIYLEVNDAFARLTGLTDVVGRRVLEILPSIKADSPELFDAYGRVAISGRPESFEFDFKTLGMWLRISVFSPEPSHFVAVFEDITVRKVAEAEIRELNEVLEQRVAARTAELVVANRELEEFTSSVSHDLRAPLRHVIGFSELLLERSDEAIDVDSRYYVQTIAESALHMRDLIDDLLRLSKVSQAELEIHDVDMGDVMHNALRPIRGESQDRRIVWKTSPLPVVPGDASLLRQVWVNLLENAVKYTRTKEVAHIEIGWLDEGAEAVFFVRDDGVGFDMRYADKLFGVFQRLHHAEEFEGNGVGLANVNRIVSRLGGRTWADAEPHKGATFYFSLPKVRASMPVRASVRVTGGDV